MPTSLTAALLDLLLPGGCGGCAAPGVSWCPTCADRTGPPRWTRGRGGPPVLAGLLAGALAAAMPPATWPGPAWTGARGRPVRWLVPAPSRAGAARDRGGDHVLRLCRLLAALLARDGHEVAVAPGLALAGGAADSVGLDAAQRTANLSGRLRTVGSGLPPPGARVLLVDDVITTGATLRACRHSLAASDVVPVAALVLCDATAGHAPDDRTGGGARDGRRRGGDPGCR